MSEQAAMLEGAKAARSVAREPSAGATVSLVICTRDRAGMLQPMLDSLEALDTADLLEIVFVDNGSTDETARILHERQAQTRLPVRIVTEPQPGLSNARNAGIRVARGAIIAFTDDDCYPDPSFVSAVARIFRENAVDIVGGPLILHDPRDHWVSTTVRPTRRMMPAGSVVPPGEISGGCMAFRRSVFSTAGLFDPELGAGTVFPTEDAEMVARACLRGHAAGFFLEPVIRHHHRRKRPEGEALMRRFAFGRGAFWAKMLLAFPERRGLLLRHWYWMMRLALRREPFSGAACCLREIAGAARYLTRRRPSASDPAAQATPLGASDDSARISP